MIFIYIYESKFFYAILNCLFLVFIEMRIYRFIFISFWKRLLSVRLLASVEMIECWEAKSSQKLSFADLTWIEICCFKFSKHVRRYFFWINESYHGKALLVASVVTQFKQTFETRYRLNELSSKVDMPWKLLFHHQLCFIFKTLFPICRLRITSPCCRLNIWRVSDEISVQLTTEKLSWIFIQPHICEHKFQ